MLTKEYQTLQFPLEHYRDSPAYVLLGEPGMGKTKAFELEAEQPGCEYIEAWDLIAFDDRPEWHNKTLFIDGLDEVRAGSCNVKEPFNAIRNRLEKLGRPRFRLSCREADWLGSSDREQLQKVAPTNCEVQELHLDELTEDDIKEILIKNYSNEVDDPSDFIKEARNRDLYDLIKNPQILDMLVSAITGEGQWPSSRCETFALACRRILVVEHSRKHSDVLPDLAQAIDKQLEAAGYLCSLLLLSDKPGFSLTTVDKDNAHPFIGELENDDPKLLRLVAKTKLFLTKNERVGYIHRTVAEYLAASYLIKLIEEKGLPVGRVLALMTGIDGIPVTALRGLFAWLVTLCETEREVLISRDVLGLILYGDVKSFSVIDKRKILDALRQAADRYAFFRSGNWTDHPFGALCTVDMEPTFKEILMSPDRSDAQQAIVDCLLDAMIHGDRLTVLTDCMMEIIRDPNWRSGIRRRALHVFIRLVEDNPERNDRLRQLLKDINNNIIPDQDDALLGELLVELYPAIVRPVEIFDYLHAPQIANHIGGIYQDFWSFYLEKQSSRNDLVQLLDGLTLRHERLAVIIKETPFHSMVGALLASGLEIHGETVTPERLFGWLRLGLDEYEFVSIDHEDQFKRIRDWIGLHPDCQKEIIDLHLNHYIESGDFYICMYKVKECFYHAELPVDYGLWCLDKARQSTNESVSKYFLGEAVRACNSASDNQKTSLDVLKEVIKEIPKLNNWLQEILNPIINSGIEELNKKREARREKEQKQRQEYIRFVKDNIDDIQAGTANSGILYNLGMAYFGRFIDFQGETAQDRLTNYFDHKGIVKSILTGLKNCLERDDIPEVQDIFQLNVKNDNKIYPLSFPFRAGLEEFCKEDCERILLLSEDKLRKAMAFYFSDGFGDEPGWYQALLRERSELVAELFVEYALAALRAKKEHISGIDSLAFDDTHKEMARYAALPILSGFPARSTNKQLESLDHLLKAALQYAEHGQFQSLIERKLKLKSMNVAQRTHWLGTAFILDSSKYQHSLVEYVKNNASSTKYLAGFFSHRSDQVQLENELSVSALKFLISIFGNTYPPHDWRGNRTAGMQVADLIQGMINKLSICPDDDATININELLKDGTLGKWHGQLQGALHQHLANKRETNFSHPDIEQVSKTLQNLSPANIADLASLTLDHIRDLSRKIRHSDTDDYKQYWNLDSNNRPVNRRHEEACRNTFLSDLKNRLAPLSIDAVPEGYFADNKRADIKVSYGGTAGFNVPIEIKCNDHKDLWYAIHNQLIKKYTRDPGAHGHGIYLVFWFGPEGTTPPPAGPRPKTASELEARLYDLLANNAERRQISVFVIDCTKPIKS